MDGSYDSATDFVDWVSTYASKLELYMELGLFAAFVPSISIDSPFGVTLHNYTALALPQTTDCVSGAHSDVVFIYPEHVTCKYKEGPVAFAYLIFDGSFPNTKVLPVNRYNWDEIFLLRV